MRTTILLPVFLLALLIEKASFAQTYGQVFVTPSLTASIAILDPNGDGYASATNSGYSSAVTTNHTADESLESEIPYVVLYHPAAEPIGDPQTGGTCNATEIVDNPYFTKHSAFYYYLNPDGSSSPNGDEKLLFRMRLAKTATGNYGYSFLIDTDNRIGSGVDPNAITGNPGFEVEVLYGSGNNGGVQVYNVDGTTSGTLLAQYTTTQRVMKSHIYNTNCTLADGPYFLDFFIDYSTINSLIGNNPLRIAWATSSSSNSALGGSAADIGGIGATTDDDAAFVSVVNSSSQQFTFYSGSVMPITLTSLLSLCDDNGALVSWKTESENNTDYFSVELSEDGKEWSDYAHLNAAGNSSNQISYELFVPFNANNRMNYARLKEIDKDGKEFLFGPLYIVCENGLTRPFPNPASDFILIPFSDQDIVAEIKSVDGVLIDQITEHSDNEYFSVSLLKNGMYLIIFKGINGQNTRIERFVKM